ncbi:MAG: peptide-methionine (S)-S-oxide reductase MsrA [Kofleriaceae bacterium]
MNHALAALLVLSAAATAGAQPPQQAPKQEVAIVAGGCFWGMENVMRKAPGVESIEVGYASGKPGGARGNRDIGYEAVGSGTTGYAESVRIVFDPAKISYADLLSHWYFRGHDPTQLDHQNNDHGTQYRSEIFTTTPEQAAIAAEVKARVERSGKWVKPIVTRIEPATTWVRAEDAHQDYLIKHPHGYNDHFLRTWFDF